MHGHVGVAAQAGGMSLHPMPSAEPSSAHTPPNVELVIAPTQNVFVEQAHVSQIARAADESGLLYGPSERPPSTSGSAGLGGGIETSTTRRSPFSVGACVLQAKPRLVVARKHAAIQQIERRTIAVD